MNVDAYFTHGEVEPAWVAGRVAIVVDVVRATTTMVEAMASGARGIIPTLSVEEALELGNTLGREDTILCGERGGLMVNGFDLGNSPRDFVAEKVGGKRLIMSTTNGTRAFRAVEGARVVLAGAFVNLAAVARAALQEVHAGADGLVVVCAGKEERFGLDDALCAGELIKLVEREWDGELVAGDGARAAQVLAERFTVGAEFLASTAAGQALVDVDLARDLEDCARVDARQVVPEMTDRQIHLRTSSDAG